MTPKRATPPGDDARAGDDSAGDRGPVLDRFSPATRAWFEGAFRAPTAAQAGAWSAISSGSNALVVAPTGSGKTLSAFLWSLDRLATTPSPDDRRHRTRVLYISPLKALGVDVERNLRAPLVGITQTAKRLGAEPPAITVGVRSGDTTSADRRLLQREPPDILITTPESLFLMLTSSARETLTRVDTVIIDEVHAVAATKRGAHLAVSLERLDALLEKPAQRIGLSATVRPREEVARFLGGTAPVEIVAPPIEKTFDLSVVVPVEDMTELGVRSTEPVDAALGEADETGLQSAGSIWPHVDAAIIDEVLRHRSTIVFANSRRLAERLTARLNELYEERLAEQAGAAAWDADARDDEVELAGVAGRASTSTTPSAGAATATPGRPSTTRRFPAEAVGGSGITGSSTQLAPGQSIGDDGDDGPVLARAHHGSVSKEQRAVIEDDLKSGRLRCVVATSSLELGIDMGAVDLVIQVESPPSVASGLQRIGRAGHQVGEISKGVLFPKHRADLLHTTVAAERMRTGLIEALQVPQNPLDILAQQTVAAVALDELGVDDWFETVRRSAPFATLPRSAYDATLDLLSGRYPSDEFAELRPRIVWDRVAGTITGRPGAQRLAVTSGGTIPDRGLFGVFIVGSDDGARRVGELDEEMVYESRVGDVFALGATSWRIEEITSDRVLVSPAFGQPGRVPFWKGDGLGRPAELGRAIGAFTAELAAETGGALTTRLAEAGLDEWALGNLRSFVAEQKESTGAVPTDRTLLVERFRDELGDWRLVLHSPYGMPVHAPWALAVTARIRERLGVDGSAMAGDDGIVVRLPDTDADPPGAELFVFEHDELEQLVTDEVGGSALFAARFRECAARALLLPRYNPGRRSPLWQQRQRSAQLLEVARKYPSFPIILETVREVLQDAYDLPSLATLTHDIAARKVRLVEVQTESPSPFARTLLFGYVAAFMYEGDSPLAERRAAALSLDPGLLAELLGRAELRELLDEKVIAQTEAELQRLVDERKAKDAEGLIDLLRLLGPLTTAELAARTRAPGDGTESGEAGGTGTGTSAGAAGLDADGIEQAMTAFARANRVIRAGIAGEERWAGVEDAARLRDAIGVPLPIGVPSAFLDPVPDPVGDLVSRYARTHGPFTVAEAAARLGLGVAVVQDALRRLGSDRRVAEGEFRPGASGTEWVDSEVLRRLRSRSLAALRQEVEPVTQDALARFLPEWQHIGRRGGASRDGQRGAAANRDGAGRDDPAAAASAAARIPNRGTGQLRGVDGLVQTIDQLAGLALPASSWESLVLPARVRDYTPAWLDELTTTGEVIWSGAGELSGGDGWVSFHLADSAPLTLAEPGEFDRTPLHDRLQEILVMGGAYFFRQLATAVGPIDGAPVDDKDLATALWDLVWAGIVGNDTIAPLRARLGSKSSPTRARSAPRARGYRGRSRYGAARAAAAAIAATAPPTVSGRWSLLPAAESDSTVRATAIAEQLLERHGVVTRGAVVAEGVRGGFSTAYRVLSSLEETGRVRRGYFVEQLGAAQFATPATVDRLRSFSRDPDDETPPSAVTLAATDPANAYGAALGWPEGRTGHRPGRKAGALVVLVDGRLAIYVERGGKTVLTFGLPSPAARDDAADDLDDAARARLTVAAHSLADTIRATGGTLRIEKIDGDFAVGTPLGIALTDAGFATTPQGLRLRG
ncbi:DEAD/DEAH box helicase [Schumannella sp. 10F1B-5-1]|uniref:Lhr family helicase n=1 Tax=Schumannella sp. 10F1B-5-1 TaxID=2590780 RepID=UPI0011303978|nr:DEAD/DEAH box helicase [Schumannella sp. 10F1B-5-1]TPW71693.1 DEAD/DEAH box helicase [Schumannella sp. 10F1B-5-1]